MDFACTAFALLLAMPPPGPGDLVRFPDKAAARFAVEFNAAFRMNMENYQAADPYWYLDYGHRIGLAYQTWHAWNALDDAWIADTLGKRFAALGRLRDALGADAYNAGRMPAIVPPAAFWEID